MNTKDLKRHFFIVLTHAENCRCSDLHHKASHRHEIGEECKAVKELQESIAAARYYLKSVGLNGMEWQPIETAPKDGTKILAREGEGEPQYWTWFYINDWVHIDCRENDDQDEYLLETWWNPTEWKPKPSKQDGA